MNIFVPCPACARHIAATEKSCPFCAHAVPADLASRAVPAAPRIRSRLAIFTFASTATAVGIVVGCSSDVGTVAAFYGLPCADPDACNSPYGQSDGAFSYDGDSTYGDASFSGDSAIDATGADDASDGGEDAD